MNNYGTGIVEKTIRNLNVRVDGRNATFSAEVPEEIVHEDSSPYEEEIIYTNPVDLLREGATPSFSLVRFAKVKNFIDGVYAVVEERVNEKGHSLSREDFLEGLEELVHGDTRAYVSAARSRETFNEPSMTIPQGFYDWNSQLTDAYRQIKILSASPGFFVGRENDSALNHEIMGQIHTAIERGELKTAYDAISGLYSRMTGKPEGKPCLFPSAELPDQEFFKELSSKTQTDLPEGLGKLLVQAVKEKRVSYIPDSESGLYRRQMHEITPLVLRDSEEFRKFLVNDKYGEILENEFISQWAGTRHTHVAHTSFDEIMCSVCDYGEPITITPELKVEPFATSYERMRDSLVFLEQTIRNSLPEVLDRKRLMNDGSRASLKIGEELEQMKLLLEGLSLVSKDSIHLQYQSENPKKSTGLALRWLNSLKYDPDLNRNTAIFVPIIRTSDGSRQVSYINAGFKTIGVNVSYKDKPSVGFDLPEGPHPSFEFESRKFRFPVLVHREVRVPYEKLINDKALRDMMSTSFTESELDALVEELEA